MDALVDAKANLDMVNKFGNTALIIGERISSHITFFIIFIIHIQLQHQAMETWIL